MSDQLQLTLKELLRISLGSETLNNVNIKLLYSFICSILKKLDCENEKVSIGGFESKYLQKICNDSESMPFEFKNEDLLIISDQMNKLAGVEQRVKSIAEQFDNHFNDVRFCNKTPENAKYDLINWRRYTSVLENICIFVTPDREVICNLLQNADFIKKLNQRLSAPLVKRMIEFEDEIEDLEDKVSKFTNQIDDINEKLGIIEPLIHDVEKYRDKIEANEKEFRNAMVELQDMLEAKLKKVHLPALRRYVKEQMDEYEMEIRMLQDSIKCPKLSTVAGTVCISCGHQKSHNICVRKGVAPVVLLPSTSKNLATTTDEVDQNKPPRSLIHCGCQKLCFLNSCHHEMNLSERMDRVSIISVKSELQKKNALKKAKLPDTTSYVLDFGL